MTKKKINLNPNSAFDVSLAKMSVKERGKAMASGQMPDEWDRKNIENELRKFESKFPGLIKRMAYDVAREVRDTNIDKHGTTMQLPELRKGFWLPAQLQVWLEQAYPTLWINERHLRWFCRHFGVFAYETYTKAYKIK